MAGVDKTSSIGYASCRTAHGERGDGAGHQRFVLLLVKPSHYDDGYVIQWLRCDIPSSGGHGNRGPRKRPQCRFERFTDSKPPALPGDAYYPMPRTHVRLSQLPFERLGVARVCDGLGVARSSFYAWRRQQERSDPPPPRHAEVPSRRSRRLPC
jgi:hypothetical protein